VNTARWRVMQAMIAMLAVMACATPPPSAQQSPSLLSPLPSTGSDIRGIVESGGVSRSFLLHLPPTGTRLRPMPLVIAFHGAPMTGAQLSSITHLSDVANTHGFAVLFPNGYMQSWAVPGSETPAQKAGIDDVAFVRSLVDSLSPQYGFDSSRVIATGISNGGIFAQVLGCRLADHLAGIVPVAGLMRRNTAAQCAPSRPVSVLEIHGTNDPLAPYQGGKDFLSLAQTLAFWVRADKCHGTAATGTLPDTAHDETTVTTSSLTGCMSGSEVTSYIVKGGGHAWPNGTPIGSIDDMGITTRQFDASELIWTFMQRHS
jgi:polyhydroxybutyrate depolymerase